MIVVSTVLIIEHNQERRLPVLRTTECLIDSSKKGLSSSDIMRGMLDVPIRSIRSCNRSPMNQSKATKNLIVGIDPVHRIIKHARLDEAVGGELFSTHIFLELIKARKVLLQVGAGEDPREGHHCGNVMVVHLPVAASSVQHVKQRRLVLWPCAIGREPVGRCGVEELSVRGWIVVKV